MDYSETLNPIIIIIVIAIVIVIVIIFTTASIHLNLIIVITSGLFRTGIRFSNYIHLLYFVILLIFRLQAIFILIILEETRSSINFIEGFHQTDFIG